MKPIFKYLNNAKYSNIRIIGLISAYTGCPRKYTCNCGKASFGPGKAEKNRFKVINLNS